MDEIFGIEVKKRDDGFEANFPQDLPGVSQQFLIWWSDRAICPVNLNTHGRI